MPCVSDGLARCATPYHEEEAFRTLCASQINDWNAMRASSTRGLVVRWRPNKALGMQVNQHGIGHLLSAAYRIHALCLLLRRRCHVDLYGVSALSDYFHFYDGGLWSTDEDVLNMYRQHGRVASVSLNCRMDETEIPCDTLELSHLFSRCRHTPEPWHALGQVRRDSPEACCRSKR
jgi:hypothetical protein